MIFVMNGCSSKDKEVQIRFELNAYEKEDIPYTDV